MMQKYLHPMTVLLLKKAFGKLQPQEEQKLESWMAESEEHRRVAEQCLDLQHSGEALHSFDSYDWTSAHARFLKRLRSEQPQRVQERSGFYWQAAAAILAIVAAFWFSEKEAKKPVLVHQSQPVNLKAPKTLETIRKGIYLELENGNKINLEGPVRTETFVIQGIHAVKKGSQFAYASVKSMPPGWTFHHTLATGKGKVLEVVLPDGSHVGMKPETTLDVKQSYIDTVREVRLLGEAYFIIKPLHAMPFQTDAEQVVIRATGTTFNVRAYREEPLVTTTLLTGEVVVSNLSYKTILKPGDQVQTTGNGTLRVTSADTSGLLTLHSKKLRFNNTGFKTVLREIERWFDVQVYNTHDLDTPCKITINVKDGIEKVVEDLNNMSIPAKIKGNRLIIY